MPLRWLPGYNEEANKCAPHPLWALSQVGEKAVRCIVTQMENHCRMGWVLWNKSVNCNENKYRGIWFSLKVRKGPEAGFLDLRTVDTRDWIILCCMGCPVCCWMLASLTCSYSPRCDNQKCLHIVPNVPWEQTPPVKNHWSIGSLQMKKGRKEYICETFR